MTMRQSAEASSFDGTSPPGRPHENCYWAYPGRLLAGEYPGAKADSETRIKLQGFLALGINGYLDLTEAGELVPYEGVLADLAGKAGLDCRYRRMSIRDVDVPRAPELMTAILDQIDEWLADNRKVYVHCWGGVGRTGTVVGCHLVRRGLEGDAALQQIVEFWTRMGISKQRLHPYSPETEAQRNYVRGWRRLALAPDG